MGSKEEAHGGHDTAMQGDAKESLTPRTRAALNEMGRLIFPVKEEWAS